MTEKKKPTPKPVEETQAPAVQPLAYHPTVERCPRCTSPLKMQATAAVSRILTMLCTKCGWQMDIEAIRKGLKKQVVPPEAETTPEQQEE